MLWGFSGVGWFFENTWEESLISGFLKNFWAVFFWGGMNKNQSISARRYCELHDEMQ